MDKINFVVIFSSIDVTTVGGVEDLYVAPAQLKPQQLMVSVLEPVRIVTSS